MLSNLFDVRTRTQIVETGKFFCPHEKTQQSYEHKMSRSWLSVSFIPILPLYEQSGYIQCQSCHRTYNENVIDPEWHARKERKSVTIDKVPASLIHNLEHYLEDGMPIEYVARDLTASGYDRVLVTQLIDNRMGRERNYCDNCGLTYAPGVTRCQECNQATI